MVIFKEEIKYFLIEMENHIQQMIKKGLNIKIMRKILKMKILLINME